MLIGLKLGIIGGGQLGGMLLRHAVDLGIEVWVLDSNPKCAAVNYTNHFVLGSPTNFDDVVAFGSNVDVVTIELEAVNTDALAALQAMGKTVAPGAALVHMIQDKYRQKAYLHQHGFPVVTGSWVAGKEQIEAMQQKLPFCFKLATSGYDGRGVFMVRTEQDWNELPDVAGFIEPVVDIEQEIAVIVARNANGEVVTYDPVLLAMDQQKQVLDYLVCPANITNDFKQKAAELGVAIANTIELQGLLAIELFITTDGSLIINELSPRPHNSGHHTIEATVTSQFEQHLRAVCNLPLGNTALRCNAITVNVFDEGFSQQDWQKQFATMLAMPDTHLHWYGKETGKLGRKLGHVTVCGSDKEAVAAKALTIKKLIRADESSYNNG
jgi:5-(carboxyamino)imidazole ribonucleotide synthase